MGSIPEATMPPVVETGGCMKLKIGDVVIRTISIYVVDAFKGFKLAAKVLFHNISMLKNRLSPESEHNVAGTLFGSSFNPGSPVATKGAELPLGAFSSERLGAE